MTVIYYTLLGWVVLSFVTGPLIGWWLSDDRQVKRDGDRRSSRG
jgi:hypothetical protein